MIPVNGYSGQKVAVLGLGRTGLSVVRALQKGGADVYAWDDSAASRNNFSKEGYEVRELTGLDWNEVKAFVLSPGIPYKFPEPHPVVSEAQSHNVPIIGDTELFAQWVNSIENYTRPVIIGVTGTNGKSTTTAMIAHVLKNVGFNVQKGGNIGTGFLDLSPIIDNSVFVLELSSYQLDLTKKLRSDIAILLYVSSDHIDRHGNFDNYVHAKKQIFRNQTKQDLAVINTNYPTCKSLFNSVSELVKAVNLPNHLISFSELENIPPINQSEICNNENTQTRPPKHFNLQNINATYIAGRRLGISASKVTKAIESFKGLEHRSERVNKIGSVVFINDSKATNEASVRDALSAYQNIYWIAGGRAKDNGFEVLTDMVENVTKGYFIGEAQPILAHTFKNKIPFENCGSLEEAVKCSYKDAKQSGVEATVVLSPACASFDQFKNFEHRGSVFKQTVKLLAGMKSEVG